MEVEKRKPGRPREYPGGPDMGMYSLYLPKDEMSHIERLAEDKGTSKNEIVSFVLLNSDKEGVLSLIAVFDGMKSALAKHREMLELSQEQRKQTERSNAELAKTLKELETKLHPSSLFIQLPENPELQAFVAKYEESYVSLRADGTSAKEVRKTLTERILPELEDTFLTEGKIINNPKKLPKIVERELARFEEHAKKEVDKALTSAGWGCKKGLPKNIPTSGAE